MERVIASEITKYLIILGVGFIALFVMFSMMVSKIKGAVQTYQKTNIAYLLIAILFFAIGAFIPHPVLIEKPFTAFILLQIYFLSLGILHLYFMHEKLKWNEDEKPFVLNLLFTLMVGVFGCIVFILVYHFTNTKGLQFAMAGSVLFFFVPLLFYYTFKQAISIPPKIFKEWFYPVAEEIEEPEDSKMKNLLVISFEFKKNINDGLNTNFRAKAPLDMDFGQLFYFFINDYNERHQNSKIQFLNDSKEAHGWIFYKKEKWYTIMTRYIDADKTIFNNHIKENDVIVCARSLI